MISKPKLPYLITILILIALFFTACNGVGGNQGVGTKGSDGPAPTLAGGGTGGDEEQANDDIDLVALAPACAPLTSELMTFDILYQDLIWVGPPRLVIGPGGVIGYITNTYDEETEVGVLQMLSTEPRDMPLKVVFPECRSDAYETTVKIQARAEGTCKDNLISLTVYEIWNSVSVDVPCEAESEVCGDDPCVYPLLLPFAYAGEQGITVKYELDPLTRTIIDGSKQLPFMGAGASGTKLYNLVR